METTARMELGQTKEWNGDITHMELGQRNRMGTTARMELGQTKALTVRLCSAVPALQQSFSRSLPVPTRTASPAQV